MQKVLLINKKDNLIVALKNLSLGETVNWNTNTYTLITDVPAKHKFATEDLAVGDIVYMYGVPVGKATKPILKGEVVTTENIKHHAAEVNLDNSHQYQWHAPNVKRWQDKTFNGIVREDGRIGTGNYWLIIPLVFCQNKNVIKLQDALEKPLGYTPNRYDDLTANLLNQDSNVQITKQHFENVDGVRALTVNSGCGGTSFDSESLCETLAAYADHPNVAGITVFSLGCEKAQVSIFNEKLKQRNPNFNKPYLFYKQQDWESEDAMMRDAIKQTFEQLKIANQVKRQPVSITNLKVGMKCGGSDGFSGISANPSMGIITDMLVSLGGAASLAEFPELCGAEGDIVERCIHQEDKLKFLELMKNYETQANRYGSSISDNPSPGNIKDGLITDAIKSTGAAKKGGSAPISAVKNYCQLMADSGLSLVCTPGNDLEAVTGQVASGANVIIFSTGLGTPTGNPIVPVIKVATNTTTANKHSDFIDFDCGPIIEGESLQKVADQLFQLVIDTASRDYIVKAERLEQYDFLFWKREVSL